MGLWAALRDESTMSPRIARRLSRRLLLSCATERTAVELTDREREVLTLIVSGCDNAAIASALYLSRATVKHHVATLFAKLGVTNRVQAAVLAVQDGLVEL
jgi:DNA-binding NarL/FixJ family response regulator